VRSMTSVNIAQRRDGFTLIEILLVLVLIALLASLATPIVYSAIERANESTLKQNLTVTRKAIDEYFVDKGDYPSTMEVLVSDKYLRTLPYDPIAKSYSSWIEIEAEEAGHSGVYDIKSSSEEQALDGSHYSDW